MRKPKRNYDPFDVMVGERIEIALHGANIDKQVAADHLGITTVSLNRYLRGAQEVRTSMLRRIARLTSRPLYFFLTSPGEKKERPLVLVVEQGGREAVKVETGDTAEIKIRFER